MPCLCWEPLFSMLCMRCTDKGISLNLDLRITSKCVVIMIMLMPIFVYMYVCIYLSNRVVKDHDCFMLMVIWIYVCMYDVV